MAASLAGLPAEMFKRIIDNLAEEDTYAGRKAMGSLRLAGDRTIEGRTAPVLLSTVSLWMSLESIENLSNISEHPVRSKYVWKIVFSPSNPVELGDRSFSDLMTELEYQPISQSKLAIKLAKHEGALATYSKQAQALGRDDTMCKILCRTLRLLPCFEILEIQFHNPWIGSTEIQRYFGNTHAFKHFEATGRDLLWTLANAMSKSNVKFKTLVVKSSLSSLHKDTVVQQLERYITSTEANNVVEAFNKYNSVGSGYYSRLQELIMTEIDFNKLDRHRLEQFLISTRALRKIVLLSARPFGDACETLSWISGLNPLEEIILGRFIQTDAAEVRSRYNRYTQSLRKVQWHEISPEELSLPAFDALKDLSWPLLESFIVSFEDACDDLDCTGFMLGTEDGGKLRQVIPTRE